MANKILIFSQDIGGAKFILPITDYIASKYNVKIFVHPLSETLFRKDEVPYETISAAFESLPPAEDEIEEFLFKNKFTHIICTLSSPYRDLTNARLIKAARKLGMPTFGVFDHWKGFDRFIDEAGNASYLPDYIGCIDEFCKEELLKYYDDAARVFITGHPNLETLAKRKKLIRRAKQEISILLISQPVVADKSFKSIFLQKIDSEVLLDRIMEGILALREKVSMNILVSYRPHPKELLPERLHDSIRIDSKDWEEALCENDIFIGTDSMMLIEAAIAGRACISLNIPEVMNSIDTVFPYKVCENIYEVSEVENSLIKAIENHDNDGNYDLTKLNDKIKGSIERTAYSLSWFVENTGNMVGRIE